MSEKSGETGVGWAIFVTCLFAALGIFESGVWCYQWAETTSQKQAIQAGVAHWTINPETGERKFEFITPGEKK